MKKQKKEVLVLGGTLLAGQIRVAASNLATMKEAVGSHLVAIGLFAAEWGCYKLRRPNKPGIDDIDSIDVLRGLSTVAMRREEVGPSWRFNKS